MDKFKFSVSDLNGLDGNFVDTGGVCLILQWFNFRFLKIVLFIKGYTVGFKSKYLKKK